MASRNFTYIFKTFPWTFRSLHLKQAKHDCQRPAVPGLQPNYCRILQKLLQIDHYIALWTLHLYALVNHFWTQASVTQFLSQVFCGPMTFDRPAINILGASVGVDHCAWKTPVTRWRQHRRHWAPTLFGARRPINSSTYLSPNIVNDNRQPRHYWCVIHLIYSPSILSTNKKRQPVNIRRIHQPIFSTCKNSEF